MIIQNRFVAPQFGLWNPTAFQTPGPGVVVLGINWCNSNSGPAVALMQWHFVEDPSDLDEDYLFTAKQADQEDSEGHAAAWFMAFDEDDEPIAAPLFWCDVRFCIPTPYVVCEDCGGVKCAGDDCEDGEHATTHIPEEGDD